MISKSKQLVIFFVLFILLAGLCGCASMKEEKDPYLGTPPEQLFNMGRKAISKSNYREGIKIFESFESQYPLDHNAEQALVEYIYAQYKTEEYAIAVAAADRYIKLYPHSSKIDYVYYLKGLINSEQNRKIFDRYLPLDLSHRDSTNFKEAYNDFFMLTKLYPHSIYAKEAKQRMVVLRNLLAQSELNIAKFYFEREAYVAALNRASNVIANFPQSPQAEEALNIMLLSNDRMGLEQSYYDALRVLKHNFPNSRFVKSNN